jgi:hypothetical protein
MALNLANDMNVFDFLQSGIYQSRSAGDTFTPYPNIECLRRVTTHKTQAVSNASVQQDSTTWHVKKADLDAAGISPQFRDRITDTDDVQWFVESFSTETLDTRYKLQCQRAKNI